MVRVYQFLSLTGYSAPSCLLAQFKILTIGQPLLIPFVKLKKMDVHNAAKMGF
jgi:hypothetical protein